MAEQANFSPPFPLSDFLFTVEGGKEVEEVRERVIGNFSLSCPLSSFEITFVLGLGQQRPRALPLVHCVWTSLSLNS